MYVMNLLDDIRVNGLNGVTNLILQDDQGRNQDFAKGGGGLKMKNFVTLFSWCILVT